MGKQSKLKINKLKENIVQKLFQIRIYVKLNFDADSDFIHIQLQNIFFLFFVFFGGESGWNRGMKFKLKLKIKCEHKVEIKFTFKIDFEFEY